MPEGTYQVEMKQICKIYDGVPVLKNVDFNVKAGEIHALVGENGAGKSTLIKILSGARIPESGKIYIGGERVHIKNPKDGIEHGISVINQELALVGDLSVAENVFIDDLRKGSYWINWKSLKEKAEKYLKEIGFGNINVKKKVNELSVAYQQIVEICRALSRNASVLVLDEPTAILTEQEANKLFLLIDQLRKKKVAIIYISHRLEEILKLADRITVLKDGELVGTVDASSVDRHQIVSMMIGRELQDFFPKRESNIGEPVLSVEHISAGKAVKDVSFQVREGEVLGISGLVGAGRTEAMRAVFGADKMDSGKIFLYGKPITIKSPKHAFALGVGFLPEDRKTQGVLLNLPIQYNVTLSSLDDFCKAFGKIDFNGEKKFVSDLSQKLSIKCNSIESLVKNLSGGNQQKVAIARLLASKCRILILDEPTRGVDVGAKIEIFDVINEFVGQHGAVIMISSEMTEIIGMCDRAVVMREGCSVGELEKDDLTEQNIIDYSMEV